MIFSSYDEDGVSHEECRRHDATQPVNKCLVRIIKLNGMDCGHYKPPIIAPPTQYTIFRYFLF